MVYTSDQLVAVLNTPAIALKAFDILGIKRTPIIPSTLRVYVNNKIFPAYESASVDIQKSIEGLSLVPPPEPLPPPQPPVEEVELDLSKVHDIIRNYAEGGDIVLDKLPLESINDEFVYKGKKYTMYLFLIERLVKQDDSIRDINVKMIEDLFVKYRETIIVNDRQIEDIILHATITENNKSAIKELLRYLLIYRGFTFTNQIANPELNEMVKSIRSKRIVVGNYPPYSGKLPIKDWASENYFDYGEYFFDGKYNLVKFPKGMKIYHGSAILADSASEFPVGRKFYEPSSDDSGDIHQVAITSPYTVPQLLTEKTVISQSWFTSPEDALSYGKSKDIKGCSDGCIQAYKLTRDCVFFLLDDDFNIRTLYNSDDTPSEVKSAITGMFSIRWASTDKDPRSATKIIKVRKSIYSLDRVFSEWFCDAFSQTGYAGYCAPEQQQEKSFHLEFITCNALLYLERDLSDSRDVFYDPDNHRPNTAILLQQMKYYETTNTHFHSGNLLQHSIWSLLFTESLIGKLTNLNGTVSERLKSVIVASGLLHDIGKMSPENCSRNTIRNKYIYYDIKDHPDIGDSYFDTGIPVLNDDLREIGRLMPQDILRELIPDISDDDIQIVRDVVRLHWFFSYDVIRLKRNNASAHIYNTAIQRYADRFIGTTHSVLYTAIATMIVSISDIEATQPYTANKLSAVSPSEINEIIRSKLFPDIVSKPKIFSGGNFASWLRVSDMGIQSMNDVLEYLQKK